MSDARATREPHPREDGARPVPAEQALRRAPEREALPRPERVAEAVAAEEVSAEAARLPIAEIARFLREHLGQRMTAYISGVNDPKMVARWIAAQNTPRDQPQQRLREGYQAARLLVSAYGDETAKAWFFGSNIRLGDQAPAYVLRHARSWEDLRLIVPAARAFVAVGRSK